MKSLFIGNLPWTTTDDELKAKFAEVCEVLSARVVTDKTSGRSRGFGFVEVNDADSEKAVNAMNGAKFGDRAIVVNEARPRTERSDRPGRDF